MKKRKELWILLFILLVAISLRLYQLGNESLWFDEGGSIRWAAQSIPRILDSASDAFHPPFYFLILHFWMMIWGSGEIAVRFLSLIFGVFSIAGIYLIGRLLFDRAVGLIAALIATLSPFHIYFSQEARMYTLVMFLSLCSMIFFQRLLRTKNFFSIAGYAFANVLLLYTHNFGFLIIAAQNIFICPFFLRFKKVGMICFRDWIILQIAQILFFIPWLRVVIAQLARIQKGYWLGAVSLQSLWQTLIDYSGSPALTVIFSILVIIAVLLTVSPAEDARRKILNSFKRRRRADRLNDPPETSLCLIWLLAPIVIPYFISKVSQPVYITRITTAASPAFYLLAARGIRSLQNKIIQVIIGVIIAGLLLVTLPGYYRQIKKERWREAVRYIESQAQAGDLLIFNAAAYLENIFNYYSGRTDLLKRGSPTGDLVNNNNVGKISGIIGKKCRVWLVLCQSGDRLELMKKELAGIFGSCKCRRFPYHNFQAHREMDIEVCLFERGGDNSTPAPAADRYFDNDVSGRTILGFFVLRGSIVPLS